MSPSHKRSLKIWLLVISLITASVILPQLSSTSAAKRQDEKIILPPQEGSKPGSASEYSEASIQRVESKGKIPSQPAPAIPNAIAALAEQSEVEPNGTSATATPLNSTSVKVTGAINPNGDQDFYSFQAAAGDRVYAATQTLFSASASTDSILEVFNTDGTTLIEGDEDDGSFGTLSSSVANVTLPTAGTYFLRVRHNSATVQLRPYYLYFQLRSGSPTPETEPNDTFPGQALPASGWVSGSTSAAADVDFYSVSLNAGDTIYLSLDMDPERNGDSNLQLGLGTFDTFVLFVNDTGAGFAPFTAPDSEAYFMTVKASGTYGILVSVPTTGGVSGTYTLNASILPAPNRGINCTTYTSTNVPQAIPDLGVMSSTLTVPGNPIIEHLQVSIQGNHTFMSDLDVELVSPSGNVVGVFNDVFNNTTGGPSNLDVTIDDYAAIPPAFLISAGMIHQPELNYRMDWFKGQNAGGTWTLRVRDDVAVDTGTITGWSLRICEPSPAPSCGGGTVSTTVFSTDFESGAAGFTHSGTQDEWELGLPATAATTTANPVAAFTTANSGVNAWKTDLDNTYNASSNQDLLSPNISLAGISGPIRLNWAQKFQMDTATNDHAWVEVRQVGLPATAKRVWEWDGAIMTLAVGASPIVNIGEAAGWGLYHADISSFAGQNIEVVFHLDSGTGATNFGGLAIDDVSVIGCQLAPCTITCPANVTQTNDPNQCGAVVNYSAPTTTGSCGTVNCSPASGSFFPVGTTTVTCTTTSGPSCSFTVTVTDDQPPSITCPANITTSNNPNQCGAVVNYPPPTITDNCPGSFTATCNPPSGSFFPVGTTTVTCTVNGFTATAGAVTNGACTPETITQSSSQTIEPLNSVSCNNGVGHTDNSYFRAFTLTSFGITGAFEVQSIDIGIEDAISGGIANTKASTSISKSKKANGPGKGKGKVAAPQGGGQPITVNIYTSSTAFPAGFPGSLTLIGTASVNVADQSGTILNVPITGTAAAGSQLVVEVFTPDGEAAGNLFFIGSNSSAETGPSYLLAADCGITTPTTTSAIGFPDMHIVMNVNGCEQVSGGGGPTCTFTVTVNDTQPPVITCPPNQTAVTATVNDPCTVVNFTTTASDNCPGVTVVCNPPSGSCFPVGVTTVTCTATDASGNTATCSFTVSIFNGRLQDDAAGCNNTVLFNTITGAYRWCCNGTIFTGVGSVKKLGSTYALTHNATDRKVQITLSAGSFPPSGTGSIQSPPGTNRCTITDRDTRNDTCVCGAATPPTQ
ncbi:MAG: HYR domain-containing protein [Blastocatellia bacterium]